MAPIPDANLYTSCTPSSLKRDTPQLTSNSSLLGTKNKFVAARNAPGSCPRVDDFYVCVLPLHDPAQYHLRNHLFCKNQPDLDNDECMKRMHSN